MKKIIYLVFALSAVFTLTVCEVEGPETDNSITSFSFYNISIASAATITGAAIEVTVPYSTALTALTAEFTTTGAEVSVDGTAQISGTTSNDFTGPVTYTVTAEDGSTRDFVVIVTIALSSAKEIESFTFTTEKNSALTADIIGDINGNEIILKVPYSTDVTSFVATFAVSGISVSVDDVIQYSEIAANDFSDTVVYLVTAEDGSTCDYRLKVLQTVNRTQLDAMIDNFDDLTLVDTSGITSMGTLFMHTGFIGDISGWDVSNVTDMHGMFYGSLTFNQDISAWDVSKVTNMSAMFSDASSFNNDISGWDVSSVTNYSDFNQNGILLDDYFPDFQ